jgi:hypothetical protein
LESLDQLPAFDDPQAQIKALASLEMPLPGMDSEPVDAAATEDAQAIEEPLLTIQEVSELPEASKPAIDTQAESSKLTDQPTAA